jgi:integrase
MSFNARRRQQSLRAPEFTPFATATGHGWIRFGTPLSVQQKLMRHADIRTTMNVYGNVVTKQESEALAQISSLTLGKQHATARTIN